MILFLSSLLPSKICYPFQRWSYISTSLYLMKMIGLGSHEPSNECKLKNHWLQWSDRQKIQWWYSSQTLPEAQRTQGIDSLTWVISPAKYNATCIGSKFGQLYVVPLVLVQNLTTRWCHQNWFQIWPTGGATCISSKFDHQMAQFALVAQLSTRWRHSH